MEGILRKLIARVPYKAWLPAAVLFVLLWPFLADSIGIEAQFSAGQVYAFALALWTVVVAGAWLRGRREAASAEHPVPLPAVSAQVRSLLLGAGFRLRSSSDRLYRASRGRHVYLGGWVEKAWRAYPIELEVRLEAVEGNRTRLSADCVCRSIPMSGALGGEVSALMAATAQAAAKLDPEALSLCDERVPVRQKGVFALGALATKISLAVVLSMAASVGVLLVYGSVWLRATRERLIQDLLVERLHFVEKACFSGLEREILGEVRHAAAGKGNLSPEVLLRRVPPRAGSFPLYAGLLDGEGRVALSGRVLKLRAKPRPGAYAQVRQGSAGNLFLGVVTGGLAAGVFLSPRDIQRTAPQLEGPMELTAYFDSQSLARIAWANHSAITVSAGPGILPDAVLLAEADRRQGRRKTGGYLRSLFIPETPSEEFATFIQEDRPGGPWRTVYLLRREGSGFRLNGFSLAVPVREWEAFRTAGRTLGLGLVTDCAALFVVIALAGLALSGHVTRPILRVRDALRTLARGDFSVRLPGSRMDEIGELERNVNDTARALREREQTKELLGKYLSREVVEEVLKGKGDLAGSKREVSVLFADIRGFSNFSERHPPDRVANTLNEYFEVMVEVIARHQGVLDKFMGDGLMAVFGAPHDQPDHARRAVKTALAMQEALHALNVKRAKRGEEPISIGIGVNTGAAIAGNLGALQRMEFTVVGDAVNLAAKLEDEAGKGQILLGPETYRLVRDVVEAESLGPVAVKGYEGVREVWRLKGLKGSP